MYTISRDQPGEKVGSLNIKSSLPSTRKNSKFRNDYYEYWQNQSIVLRRLK